MEGLKNFFVGIGTGIDNFLNVFNRFNFREDDKKIKDTFEESNNNLTKLNKDFRESVSQFARDKDINSAGQVAADLGIGEGGDMGEVTVPDLSPEQEGNILEAAQTFTADEVAVIEETGVIPEPRAEGGPVIEGRPYMVGEEGEELFVPNESGEIVPNDELNEPMIDAVGDAANIESTGGEDTAMSVTPDTPSSSGTPTTTAAPTTSSLDGEDFQTDDETISSVDPIKSDKSNSLTPIRRSRNNLRSRRRKQTIVQIGGGGGQQPMQTPSASGGTQTKTIVVGNSSTKTLLDLQSLNNKHN